MLRNVPRTGMRAGSAGGSIPVFPLPVYPVPYEAAAIIPVGALRVPDRLAHVLFCGPSLRTECAPHVPPVRFGYPRPPPGRGRPRRAGAPEARGRGPPPPPPGGGGAPPPPGGGRPRRSARCRSFSPFSVARPRRDVWLPRRSRDIKNSAQPDPGRTGSRRRSEGTFAEARDGPFLRGCASGRQQPGTALAPPSAPGRV